MIKAQVQTMTQTEEPNGQAQPVKTIEDMAIDDKLPKVKQVDNRKQQQQHRHRQPLWLRQASLRRRQNKEGKGPSHYHWRKVNTVQPIPWVSLRENKIKKNSSNIRLTFQKAKSYITTNVIINRSTEERNQDNLNSQRILVSEICQMHTMKYPRKELFLYQELIYLR